MSKGKKALWNMLFALSVLCVVSMAGSKLLIGWSSIFSYRLFFTMSESMEPEIGVHQLVLGKMLTEESELMVGEIYAYRRKGLLGTEMVIHRLVSVMEDGSCQFQGDANELPDAEAVQRGEIGYVILFH